MAPSRRHMARKRSPTASLPPALALLEQVTEEFTAVKHSGFKDNISSSSSSNIQYVLMVTHKTSKLEWTYYRSFEDYVTFQHRLLQLMRQGHSCQAQCPFLYSFVKNYFPKPSMFGRNSTRLMKSRCDAIKQCFTTLKAVLLNRGNHGCSILTDQVASHVVDFIVGDLTHVDHPLYHHYWESGSRASTCSSTEDAIVNCNRHDSRYSLHNSTFDDVDSSLTCALCHHSLDEEAYSNHFASFMSTCSSSSTLSSNSTTSTSSSGSSGRLSGNYGTTLKCGHRFHDECIIPKLNESLHCPICRQAQV